MDLKQLEAFAQVVRMGSFSRAAEALFLTQPTVSAHIATLERELGVPLVLRGGRTAEPTEVGRTLYDYALSMLALRDEALAACGKQGGVSGLVRIAASTVTYQYVLPRLMSRFRQLHSGVTFDIRSCDSEGVAREIIAGRAEVGLTGAVMESACLYREFMEDQLVVVTPPGPPFDTMSDFSLDDLMAHPFISREAGSGTRRETEIWLGSQGLAPTALRVVASMEEPDAIKNAVSQGLGISIISSLAVSDFQQLGLVRAFPLMGQPIKRRLYIVRHRRRVPGPAAGAFVEFVLKEHPGEAGQCHMAL